MTLRKRKFRLGIKGKLFLIVSAIFIVFMTFSSVVLISSYRNIMNQVKLSRVEERTAIMGRGIQAEIINVADTLRLVAESFHLIERSCLFSKGAATLKEQFTAYLDNASNASQFFESISVYDEYGNLHYGVEQKFQHGLSIKEMRWFKSIEYNGSIVYGYFFYSKELNKDKENAEGKTLFPVGLSFENSGKKYFICGLISLEKLTDKYLNQSNTLDQTAFLINSNGVVLNSTKPEYKGVRILQSQLVYMQDFDFGARRYLSDNLEFNFGFYKIPQADMYCVVYLYHDKYDEWRNELVRKTFYIRLAASLCVILVIVGLFLPFVRVIRSMTSYVIDILNENYKTAKIDEKILKRNDELGDFAVSLKTMVNNLLSLLDKADENAKVKNSFMERMCSEMRMPVNNIIANCQLAQQSCTDPLQKNYLYQIDIISGNLFKLVNNIADFSKYDIETCFAQDEIFSIQDVLSSIRSLLKSKAAEKGLRYDISIKENVPAYIRSNKENLRRILLNLTHNAIKFTNTGFVRVEVSCEHYQSGGLALHIEVVDSGIGMSEERIKKILSVGEEAEREQGFISVNSSGLLIVRTIVNAIGGKIGIYSREGEGTSVKVVVPIEEVELDSPKNIFDVFDDEAFLSVLVAEGDKLVLQRLQNLLEQANCRVFSAVNREDAVKIAKEHKIDIAFVDMEMPFMDGSRTVADILAIPELRNLYIVALSSVFSYEEKVRCFEIGIMDCLEKNFSTDVFYLELKKWAEWIKGME